MKIGLITENFQQHYECGEIFHKLKQIGYDGVDYTLSLAYNKPEEIFSKPRSEWTKHYKHIAEEMKNNDIVAFQPHATFPTDFDGAKCLTDYTLDQFRKEIEAAAILNSPYIVIHPINIAVREKNKQQDFEVNMDAFGKLLPVLEEFGVTLGVENMFTWDNLRRCNCPTGCSSAEDMIRYIDSMKSEHFKACLDTGHMLINCFSPAEAVRKLGKRLKLLHVHDNYGLFDNHNAPGQGSIDWHDFAAALKETGYDGAFCMETSFSAVMRLSTELGWEYAKYAYAAAKKIVEMAE